MVQATDSCSIDYHKRRAGGTMVVDNEPIDGPQMFFAFQIWLACMICLHFAVCRLGYWSAWQELHRLALIMHSMHAVLFP